MSSSAHSLRFRCLAIAVLLATATALRAQSWNALTDFSATQNPAGPWTYGWSATTGQVAPWVYQQFTQADDVHTVHSATCLPTSAA